MRRRLRLVFSHPAGRRAGHAVVLAAALVFVFMVVYLPHMVTFEAAFEPERVGKDQPFHDSWFRLGDAYGKWVVGEWDDYPYPLHLDSQVHWTRIAALQDQDTLMFHHPYTGDPFADREARTGTPESLRGLVHESGFWLAFGQFQEMTGIEWREFVRFAPAVMAMVTAALVWAALRPAPWAPMAAAFVALIPTTARFLGIGLFVPIGFGLAWVAAALLLSNHVYRDARFMIMALLLGAWAFFVHLIAGFAFVLVLTAAAFPLWRENRGRTVFLAMGVALPFFVFYDLFSADFQTEIDRVGWLPIDFTVFDHLGVPFLLVWVAGTTLVMSQPPAGRARVPAVAATLGSMVALGFIVVNVALRLERYALYDRWHQVFALLAVVPVAYALYMGWRGLRWLMVAGYRGYVRLGGRRLSSARAAAVLPGVGFVVLSAAFVGVAGPGLEAHVDEPYYRSMNDDLWEAYVYAQDLGPEYAVYLTHPWPAHVFNAMSGKTPYTFMDPGQPPVRGSDFQAYREGRFQDGVWLVERDITLVIDPVAPSDPAFRTVAPNVHVLDRDLALQLYEARRGG